MNDYVFGVSSKEDQRLALQHEILFSWTKSLWDKANLASGMKAIDLGCGPGHVTIDLARFVGDSGHVFAIDRSADYLTSLKLRMADLKLTNVTPIQIDANDVATAPIADNSAHFAFARYLLCYTSKPDQVVSGLAQKIRRGGTVVIQDFYNYEFAPCLAPRSAVFDSITKTMARAISNTGGNPDIAGYLPDMLVKAGFIIKEIESRQFLARPGTKLWELRSAVYQNILPHLTKSGVITLAEQEDFFAILESASKNPNAFIIHPTIVAITAEKK